MKQPPHPAHFINRELSWLEFNRRVLEEAQDPHQPLLERLKFLCIFCSNLDEFFEIRVAGIKQQLEHDTDDAGPDNMTPAEIFAAINKKVRELADVQHRLWKEELLPLLEKNGIFLPSFQQMSREEQQWLREYFKKEVFPVLTPLAVDPSHPFPQLLNKSHNLIVSLRRERGKAEEPVRAVVQMPRVLPRLIRIGGESGGAPWRFCLLPNLIHQYVGELFPGLTVESCHAFRVTRNSDLYIDEEEVHNLLSAIESELRKRNRGNAVRLEVEKDCPAGIQKFLLGIFRLGEADLYLQGPPLTMLHLMPLCGNEAFASLRDKLFAPIHNASLPREARVLDVIREKDVLLHHPYETFDSVVDLVEQAAEDPQVLAIKMTLYRTSGDSPIVKALIEASRKHKQVTVLVELKARFDEANNIQWARQMEEAGIHVVYGVVGLKVHCKALMVVRRDKDRIRHYVHLGTGNYHPKTARIYSDLSLFTARPEITGEVASLFNILTGVAAYPGMKKLMVSPFDMQPRLKARIGKEMEFARAGKGGRIILKLNALVEEELIQALYDASGVGVKINLMVRGICCLRPGIPGVSENIRVISIVGRFLEHSRIFYFGNGGAPEIYLSSADWMPRNFYRRVELAFLVEDPALRARLEKEILPVFLNDNGKARLLQGDGSYRRLKPRKGETVQQAQLAFREMARRQAAAMGKTAAAAATRLTPVGAPPG
ncbi:MAG: polyphosphate kinase 1 [Verrucomicrobiae bacterium]|nr:polyphosphate kinase 1 [Verrucomicrobiae bacterium]